jgi:hypothetical protein
MIEALRAAGKFIANNLTRRDPRSPRRHPWKWCLFVICDVFIARIPVPRPKSGVVVILVNRLGDAIVGRPLVLAIQSHVKHGEPFLVLGDNSWRVLKDNLYAEIPTRFIDEERFRTSMFYRVRIGIWLRMQNYQTAICFMHHRLEMRDDALVYVSAGKERIVAGLPFLDLRWYPWLFEFYLNRMTTIVPPLPPLSSQSPHVDVHCKYMRKVPHAFERFQDFCDQLYPGTTLSAQLLTIPPERQIFSGEIVILNPGAKHEARMWPLREWVSLAYQIAESGYTVCFTGGPAEEDLSPELHRMIEEKRDGSPEDIRILVLINQLSFNALVGLFGQACCYIGPDTGTSHLAYWLGTPTITLLLHNRGTEEGDRFGDFFPYPAHFLGTPYKCVCTTKAKFHLRDGSVGIRPQVFAVFRDLMRDSPRRRVWPDHLSVSP